MSDLRLFGDLHLLEFDVVSRHLRSSVFYHLLGIQRHHLFVNVHIISRALLNRRTWVSDSFEPEIGGGYVDGDWCHDRLNRIPMIDRHLNSRLNLVLYDFLGHSHIKDWLVGFSLSRKRRIIMHPKLFVRVYSFTNVLHLDTMKLLDPDSLVNLTWTCRRFTSLCSDLTIRLKTLELHFFGWIEIIISL